MSQPTALESTRPRACCASSATPAIPDTRVSLLHIIFTTCFRWSIVLSFCGAARKSPTTSIRSRRPSRRWSASSRVWRSNPQNHAKAKATSLLRVRQGVEDDLELLAVLTEAVFESIHFAGEFIDRESQHRSQLFKDL